MEAYYDECLFWLDRLLRTQLRLEPTFWTHTSMHAYSCTAKHALPLVLPFHFVTFVCTYI